MRPFSSTTCSRPPICTAAVAITLPFSTTRELGGAAADVDVEDALALVVRDPRGARAVGGEHRLHVMAGGGADEIAAAAPASSSAIASAFSRRSASPVRITTPVSMSSGCEAGGRVGLVDDGGERRVVDALLALIGRQRHRRLVERLARDDVVAAGEVLAVAAQVDAGEDDLRAGRADVDADAHQRDVVLQPDRVLLQRLVGVELEMVVVVVGIAVVVVHDVLAEQVVGERMRLLVCRRCRPSKPAPRGRRQLPSCGRLMAYPAPLGDPIP